MEDRLQKFARLIDAGSFTRASQELHISQPALSMAINKLESELSAPLILRNGHSLEMTEAGKIAYATAKELGTLSGNLKDQILEMTSQRPIVRIGMIDSIASTLFSSSKNVDELEKSVDMSVVVNNSRYLQRAVQRGEIDVAFIVEQKSLHFSSLEQKYIASEPLVVVCHAQNKETYLEELGRKHFSQFLCYDQSSSTRQLIDETLQDRGITIQPKFFSTSPEIILRLVQLKKGVTALPYSSVKDLVEENKLAILGGDKPLIIERRINALKRRGKHLVKPLSQTQEQVRGMLSQYYDEIGENL